MQNIKNILVGLDGSYMDKTLIPYTHFITKLFPVKKLYVINIIKNLNIPHSMLKDFPELINETMHGREESLREEVGKEFKDSEVEIEYVIDRGNSTKFIMEFSEKHDIHLILIGRKITLPSSSATGPRLARRANCSLLIIPEGSKPKLKKIQVPIDYSIHSKLAFHYATEISRKIGEKSKILTQNVYSIPAGWHYTGKTKKEFIEIMKKNAREGQKVFLKEFKTKDLNIESLYHLDDNDDLTSDILRTAQDWRPDWIMIGAKGRTAATALFIGSFAEKLITTITHIPIFIARPKGKNAGFIDYIKEI